MVTTTAPHSALTVARTRVEEQVIEVQAILHEMHRSDGRESEALVELGGLAAELTTWHQRAVAFDQRENARNKALDEAVKNLCRHISHVLTVTEQIEDANIRRQIEQSANDVSQEIRMLSARLQGIEDLWRQTAPRPVKRVAESRPEYAALPGMEG
jgi:small-conductance mechanosensitive channel